MLEAQCPASGKDEWIPIAAVESFSRRIRRSCDRRRGLDSFPLGVCFDLMPHASTIEITIKRGVLYKATMLEALGIYNFEDLCYFNVPIQLKEIRYIPHPGLGVTVGRRVISLPLVFQEIVYKGCIITSNPIEYDLTRDFSVIQDVEIQVARIEEFTPSYKEIRELYDYYCSLVKGAT